MKILATGDLHIGRSSARIPDAVESSDLRSSGAWERIVDHALAERVAVVLLAGDVVDCNNGFWEAYGPLERGVLRLGEQGVRCVAVAGNHDHQVMRRLASSMPGDFFSLLGATAWSRLVLRDRNDHPALAVDGWSFGERRVSESALNCYDLHDPDDGVPLLGMIHGDLGVADSRYNPLDTEHLLSLPPQVWILGHTHQHRVIGGERWICYPGSPQALDPGEPGSHGPVLFELSGGRFTRPQLLPISSVAYESLEVDMSTVEEADAVEGHILRAIRDFAVSTVSGGHLHHLSLRLTMSGTCPYAAEVESCCRNLLDGIDVSVEDVAIHLDSVISTVIPPIDLEELAGSRTAIGTAARLLLELEDQGRKQTDETFALLQDARRRFLSESGRVGCGDVAVDETAIRLRLARQTRRVLLKMLGDQS